MSDHTVTYEYKQRVKESKYINQMLLRGEGSFKTEVRSERDQTSENECECSQQSAFTSLFYKAELSGQTHNCF